MSNKVTSNRDLGRVLVDAFGGKMIDEGKSVTYVSKSGRKYTCRYTKGDSINIRPVTSYSVDGIIAVASNLFGKVLFRDDIEPPKAMYRNMMVPLEQFIIYWL